MINVLKRRNRASQPAGYEAEEQSRGIGQGKTGKTINVFGCFENRCRHSLVVVVVP